MRVTKTPSSPSKVRHAPCDAGKESVLVPDFSERAGETDWGVGGLYCDGAISRYQSRQEIFSSLRPSWSDVLHFVKTGQVFFLILSAFILTEDVWRMRGNIG